MRFPNSRTSPGGPACPRRRAVAMFAAGAWAVPALASPPPVMQPYTASQNATDVSGGFMNNLQKGASLLGDVFGVRSFLSRYGLSLAIQEVSEVQGNVTGGIHRGGDYDGLTQATLQLDTARAFGLYGGLFDVSALQIHGRNLSADNLLSLQTSSGIQSDRATRLWEVWYDQKFLDEDRLDIKIGQQSLDTEFIVTQNGAYFLNTMFGWPLVPSVDLPGGGPAYPLSALGVRARYRPTDAITLLAGAYNGSPSSPVGGDSQMVNDGGTQFPTGNRRLYFAELQDVYPALGSMVYPGAGAPLGHTYKIGAWYDSEAFDDELVDSAGTPLADANSNGMPRSHRGDYSIYAVADQMVWRAAADPNRSVSVFGRAMGTPQADRNLVDVSLNAGVVMHEPIDNRPDDTLALGMGFAHVSNSVSQADRDTAIAAQQSGQAGLFPVRGTETYLEATYQYQVRPWWQIQPDLQYTFDPGGGIANPLSPDRRLGDELVLGLRTIIAF